MNEFYLVSYDGEPRWLALDDGDTICVYDPGSGRFHPSPGLTTDLHFGHLLEYSPLDTDGVLRLLDEYARARTAQLATVS